MLAQLQVTAMSVRNGAPGRWPTGRSRPARPCGCAAEALHCTVRTHRETGASAPVLDTVPAHFGGSERVHEPRRQSDGAGIAAYL